MIDVIQLVEIVPHGQISVQDDVRPGQKMHQNATGGPISDPVQLHQHLDGLPVRRPSQLLARYRAPLEVVDERHDETSFGGGKSGTHGGRPRRPPRMGPGLGEEILRVVILAALGRFATQMLAGVVVSGRGCVLR